MAKKNKSIRHIYNEATEIQGIFLKSTSAFTTDQLKYEKLRDYFINDNRYYAILPSIVHEYPKIKEFRNFIINQYKNPEERIIFVEEQFVQFLDTLEKELRREKEQTKETPQKSGSFSDDLNGAKETKKSSFDDQYDYDKPTESVIQEKEEYEKQDGKIDSVLLDDEVSVKQKMKNDSEIDNLQLLKPISGKRKGFSIEEDIDGVIGVKDIAAEIATMLQNLKIKEKGKMIGIFGKWGRGKTFLMEQIWERLGEIEENKFYRVKFHAWKYQDTPASWAYLYESFANRYYRADEKFFLFKPIYIIIRRWRLNLKRYGYLPIFGLLLPIIMFILGYYGIIEDLKIIIDRLGNVLLGVSGLGIITLIYKLYVKFNSKATDLFKKYMHEQSFHQLLGVQAEIQKELKNLLKTWISNREVKNKGSAVLLVVDDIDRCQETRLIQIIDSLRIMLEDSEISKRVIVLAAIDGNVLKRAIKWKYYDLIETDYEIEGRLDQKIMVSKDLIKEYLDKLFLSGIKLGVLTSEERLDIFVAFTDGKVAPEKTIEDDRKQLIEGNNSEESETEIQKTFEPQDLDEVNKKGMKNLKNNIDNFITESTYDLEPQEAIELNYLIEMFKDATPRQIRIFYYRYLLARNLLDRQIQKLNLTSSGKRKGEISLMGELLLHYTLSSDTDELREIKKQIAESDSENYTIKLNGTDYTDNGKLLYSVYNVLEMVIAY